MEDTQRGMPRAIRTERLTVRRVVSEDWRDIREIWQDFKKSRYSCYDRYNDTSADAVRSRIGIWADYADSHEHMFYAVCLDGKVIGFFSFSIEGNGYETGYCFHSAYHAKGYAKESFCALRDALREYGADHISAGTALKNLPSFEFLMSCGFMLMGTEQISFYTDVDGNDIFFEGGYFLLPL